MKQPSPTDAAAEAHRHHLAGRLADAEAGYRQALRSQPKNPQLLHLLGTLLHQRGEHAEAARLIERAIKLQPSAAMYINLGAARRANKEPDKAANACRRATQLAPHAPEGFVNLGHALRDLEDYEGAVAAYRRYLALKPGDASTYVILGEILRRQQRRDDAVDAFDTALVYDPANPKAHLNIAGILRENGWFHASREILERLAATAPGNPEAQKTLGVLALLLGDFARGWPLLEHRFASETERIVRQPTPPPYWVGEDLTGKNILIWTEQGIGDTILQASMFNDVIARAQRCHIACQERLVPVFARSFQGAHVMSWDQLEAASPAGLDFQVAAMSLGQFVRPAFSAFPRHSGYLRADTARAAALRARYQQTAGARRIVGVSWRSRDAALAEAKSLDLETFAPLLTRPDLMFVNLQYGDCREDLARVRAKLGVEIFQDDVDPLTDMDAFFAQTAAMDAVVTTSNTTAHVAGSLNVPVYILLPYAKGSIWYWFARRTDSPWYPSARLLRAPRTAAAGAWAQEPVAEAARQIETAPA